MSLILVPPSQLARPFAKTNSSLLRMSEEIPSSSFDILLSRDVPHILENIFFSLEYDSFMACKKVCKAWNELYSSEQYRQKELELFEEHKKREEMEEKLRHYSSHGDAKEVRLLLSIGVKQRPDRDGYSPLHNATTLAVIKQLIVAGGDINARDARGETPLNRLRGLNVEEIKLLLDEGANPNCADNLGRSPLHEAARYGRIRVVQLLLDAGANPHQADLSGETPMSVASYYGWKYVVQLLKSTRGDRPAAVGQADSRPHRPHPSPLTDLMSLLSTDDQ